MRKIIALLLALVMCFALVACGETPNNDNPDNNPVDNVATGTVEDARNYVFNMYKAKAGKVMRDFEVVGAVTIGGVVYNIDWTVEVTSGSAEDAKVVVADNVVTVDINEKPTEELVFNLVATVKDAEGKTADVSFEYSVDAVASTGTIFVENPEVGVPYKFALNQNGLDTPATLYLTGEMSGNYLATSENVLDAVDVVLEETEGGYYITFMDGEAKKYVNITTYTKDDGSLKNTQKIEDAPSVPYTWDAERGTMVADLGDLGKFYIGTYGTYNTMSTSATSYIEDVTKIGVSQFPAGFATVTPTIVEAPEVGKAYVFGLQQNGLDTPATLYFTGEMSGNYLATSTSLADAVRVYVEETEGGYYLAFWNNGKKYINITTYTKDDGSLKNTQKIEDAPSVPYTWDAERLTFVGDLGGDLGTFYMGTYGTYNTISTSATSYIEDVTKIGVSQFPAGLYDFNLPGEDLNRAPEVVEEEEPEEVVAPTDPVEIVNAAYALADGATLPYTATLVGTVASIDTPYSAEYGNITVTITVAGAEDKPLQCYRLKGEGADAIAVGDTIIVTGTLKNYKGTYEFDAGCTFTAVPTDALEIVAAAYALADGASLPYESVLTGTITSIDTPYSADYKNITVTIAVEGAEDKPIQCYRLKGEGAENLAVGDVIVVKGTLKNYKGTYEFDAGCTLG